MRRTLLTPSTDDDVGGRRLGSIGVAVLVGLFIAGKLVGGYIATWSWWWLLMPIVPLMGTAIHGSLQ